MPSRRCARAVADPGLDNDAADPRGEPHRGTPFLLSSGITIAPAGPASLVPEVMSCVRRNPLRLRPVAGELDRRQRISSFTGRASAGVWRSVRLPRTVIEPTAL